MKLQDIEFPKGTHQTFWEFYDLCRQIFNNGRYQLRVVTEVPDWPAPEGEMLLHVAEGVRSLFVYMDEAWRHLAWTAQGQEFTLENRTSDPPSPETGRMWFRTDV